MTQKADYVSINLDTPSFARKLVDLKMISYGMTEEEKNCIIDGTINLINWAINNRINSFSVVDIPTGESYDPTVQGQSEITPEKEEILVWLLTTLRDLSRRGIFTFIDLFAGSGMNDKCLGSPLAFLSVFNHRADYEAYFIDKKPDQIDLLGNRRFNSRIKNNPNCHLFCETAYQFIKRFCDDNGYRGDKLYGCINIDPCASFGNSLLKELIRFGTLFPNMSLIFNYCSIGIKVCREDIISMTSIVSGINRRKYIVGKYKGYSHLKHLPLILTNCEITDEDLPEILFDIKSKEGQKILAERDNMESSQ